MTVNSGRRPAWKTPEDFQVLEYMDRMCQDNFIDQADYRQAMKSATPALAAMKATEKRGELFEKPTLGPNACEAHGQGQRQTPMSWEPQPPARGSLRR